MTNRIWPADAINGAPAYSGRALRQTQAPFLAGAKPTRPLGARSGVRPGTSAGTVGASPTQWYCGPHAGVLDVMTAAEAGPYTYAVDAGVTGSVDASNASNPRTDIVYVQLADPAEEGTPGQPPSVTVAYKAGVAGPSAVVPSAPARSMVLARINVPKTGGGNPTVTWVAPIAVAAGGIVPVPSSAARDAIAYDGLTVYREDTGAHESRRRGVWYSSEHYAEFTTLSNGAPNGSLYGVGSITLDAGASGDASFVTVLDSGLQLPPGDYSWALTLTPGGSITGRSFVEAVFNGKTQRFAATPNVGEDTFTGSGTFRLPAQTAVTWRYFKTTTVSPSSVTGRLYLKRAA